MEEISSEIFSESYINLLFGKNSLSFFKNFKETIIKNKRIQLRILLDFISFNKINEFKEFISIYVPDKNVLSEQYDDKPKITLLSYAIMNNNLEIVQILLDNKIDVNIMGYGSVPFKLCYTLKNLKIAKMLIKCDISFELFYKSFDNILFGTSFQKIDDFKNLEKELSKARKFKQLLSLSENKIKCLENDQECIVCTGNSKNFLDCSFCKVITICLDCYLKIENDLCYYCRQKF